MRVTNGLVRMSALHRTHLRLGAKIHESQGWLLPNSYRSVNDEVNDVFASAGLCDISHYGKIDVKGNEVDRFLQVALPALASKEPGDVKFSIPPRAEQSTSFVQYVCRLTKEHALILTRPLAQGTSVLDVPSNLLQGNQKAYLTNLTSVFAGLCLLGPASERILGKLTQLRLNSWSPDGSFCTEGGLAKVNSLIVRRNLTRSGRVLPSFDLYFGRDYAEYVWDAVMNAGSEFKITPFGLEALSRILGESDSLGRMGGGK